MSPNKDLPEPGVQTALVGWRELLRVVKRGRADCVVVGKMGDGFHTLDFDLVMGGKTAAMLRLRPEELVQYQRAIQLLIP